MTHSWNKPSLFVAPDHHPAEGFEADARIRPIFYAGEPWRGRPTKVFAWLGMPEGEQPVPAVVLVHGGGGTAFRRWVQRYVELGYAAIAMDTCGCVAGGSHANRPRHEHGGPPGWGGFDQLHEPFEDTWNHHAVADILLAHSLLRSLPRVDPDRIGLNGISWGATLAVTAAAVDGRFRAVVPVYGATRFAPGQTNARFAALSSQHTAIYRERFDPLTFAPRLRAPSLWINGTNDPFFSPPAWQTTIDACGGTTSQSFQLGLVHAQDEGALRPETFAFFDHTLRDRPGWPSVHFTAQGPKLQIGVRGPAEVTVLLTTDDGPWPERRWTSLPMNPTDAGFEATIPADARAACACCLQGQLCLTGPIRFDQTRW